jgi:hypothetical protein
MFGHLHELLRARAAAYPDAVAFGGLAESPQAFAARLQAVCYALTRQAEAALRPGAAGRPKKTGPAGLEG